MGSHLPSPLSGGIDCSGSSGTPAANWQRSPAYTQQSNQKVHSLGSLAASKASPATSSVTSKARGSSMLQGSPVVGSTGKQPAAGTQPQQPHGSSMCSSFSRIGRGSANSPSLQRTAALSPPVSHALSLTQQALLARPAGFCRPLRTVHSMVHAMSPPRRMLPAPGALVAPGSPEDLFSIQTPSVVKKYMTSQVGPIELCCFCPLPWVLQTP